MKKWSVYYCKKIEEIKCEDYRLNESSRLSQRLEWQRLAGDYQRFVEPDVAQKYWNKGSNESTVMVWMLGTARKQIMITETNMCYYNQSGNLVGTNG